MDNQPNIFGKPVHRYVIVVQITHQSHVMTQQMIGTHILYQALQDLQVYMLMVQVTQQDSLRLVNSVIVIERYKQEHYHHQQD